MRHAAIADSSSSSSSEARGSARLSYNVVLTLGHLYVFPRRRESHTLAESGEPLSVNALGFAGYLLVKSEAEMQAVRMEGPTNVLRAVAWESVHDLQVDDGDVA